MSGQQKCSENQKLIITTKSLLKNEQLQLINDHLKSSGFDVVILPFGLEPYNAVSGIDVLVDKLSALTVSIQNLADSNMAIVDQLLQGEPESFDDFHAPKEL